MHVYSNQTELIKHLQSVSDNKTTIGFVPTMGALHKGHLSLMTEALTKNDLVVVSIFVNPTQFNNKEDLEKYPRSLGSDIEKIKSVSKDIIVYTPTVEDIYQGNTTSEHFDFDGLENVMEGEFRPGHFDGVGTVVKYLFDIVKPTNAYFGEKDFQQLQIIKKLVDKYKIPVNVTGCPISREPNGLAMSSRNERLSEIERQKASIIYDTLINARNLFKTKYPQEVIDYVTNVFDENKDFELEYFQIAEESTLSPCINKEQNKKYRAFIAVFVNNIRLIDTISLN